MAQDATFQGSEVADRAAGSAPADTNIPHPDAVNRQSTANCPSIIETLLQDPVLAAGENIDDFRALVEEVSGTVQPNSFFDRLLVSDLCHAWWEEQRFRRQQAALPEGTRLKALQCLLASSGFEPDALTIATDYFGLDADERTKATALVRRLGISDDAIAAQGCQHNLQTISALDRLMANRQSRRDMIVREYQRRKRKAKSPASPQSDQPNERPAGITH